MLKHKTAPINPHSGPHILQECLLPTSEVAMQHCAGPIWPTSFPLCHQSVVVVVIICLGLQRSHQDMSWLTWDVSGNTCAIHVAFPQFVLDLEGMAIACNKCLLYGILWSRLDGSESLQLLHLQNHHHQHSFKTLIVEND